MSKNDKNIDEICDFLSLVADWVSRLDTIPLIYAACHRTRSSTRPRRMLGLLFQAVGHYDWWEIAGERFDLPNRHLMITCHDHQLTSSPPRGDIELWACSFSLDHDRTFDAFLNNASHPWMIAVRQGADLTRAYDTVARCYARVRVTPDTMQNGLRLKAAILNLVAAVLDEVREGGNAENEPTQVRAAIDLMYRKMSDARLSLPDIAREARMDIHHLGRLFKRSTGLTPMSYLRDLRLSHARHLLSETSLRISEIAWEVGYTDPLHFSRVFRRQVGNCPRNYRKKH